MQSRSEVAFENFLKRQSPYTRSTYVSMVKKFLSIVGEGRQSYDASDINTFIAYIDARPDIENHEVYIRGALSAVKKFLEHTGLAKPEVINYVKTLIAEYSRKVQTQFDMLFLNRDKVRRLVYSKNEADLLLKSAIELDQKPIEFKLRDRVYEKTSGEVRGWVRTLLVGLAMETGCRPIELLRIRFSDIEIQGDRAVITIQTAKRGKPIVAIVGDRHVVSALKKRLEWMVEKGGVTPESRLLDISRTQAYRYMWEVAKHAGINYRKRTFYGFRRADVINLLETGLNPVVVAEAKGWRSLRMVSYYFKVDAYEVAEKAAAARRSKSN